MLFYELCYNDKKYKDIDYADETDWESIKCPKFDGHQRNGNRIGQLRIKISNRKYGDFLWTFLSEWLLNEKVVEVFTQNKITGYELKPVEIVKGKAQFNLWEFVIIGKGGEAKKESGIYLKQECQYCGLKVYSAYENGIIVDEKNWDGSDIFTVVGYSRYILVTEKVKELIKKHKLTGVYFLPSNELKWPNVIVKP